MTKPVYSRIYLLRSEVTEFANAIAQGHEGWKPRLLSDPGSEDAELWIRPNAEVLPSLLDRYQGYADLRDIKPNRTSSSVLLVRSGGRIFAECTGNGRTLVLRDRLVEDFGVVLTSRFGNGTQFRAVESRVSGQGAGVVAIRRRKGGSIQSMVPSGTLFEVQNISVFPGPQSASARLEEGGIGYLERSAFCGVRERKTRFGKYLAEYQGGSSLPASITSKRFWQLTRDSTESAELYRELFAEIADGNPNNRVEFWFPGQPEVASGRQIQTKIGRSTFFGQDPDWKALASYFEGKVDLSPERLLGTAVVLEVDGEPIDHTSLLSCLHMELEYEGEFYVHDRGFWLRASGEHVQSVRRRIEEFEVDHRTSGLLDWDKEWDEDRFNTENGKLHCWQCSHPRLWTEAGQRYGIELADLIGANGQTVHVKKYKSVAKSLSHLLSQTQAAAGAYAASQSARAWINDYRTMIPGGYVGEHATIVIALGSSQFAKMSQIPSSGGVMAIGNAISSITQLGYGLQLVTVPIEDV